MESMETETWIENREVVDPLTVSLEETFKGESNVEYWPFLLE
jgi:hypothetical protein